MEATRGSDTTWNDTQSLADTVLLDPVGDALRRPWYWGLEA